MPTVKQLREALDRAMKEAERKPTFPEMSVYDIAKRYGLDTSDIRIRALAQRHFETPKEKHTAVLNMAKTIHFAKPTEADMPSFVAKERAVYDPEEALEAEYRAGAQDKTGQALVSWKMHMRQKGWKGS